jgi:hypothetical protein
VAAGQAGLYRAQLAFLGDPHVTIGQLSDPIFRLAVSDLGEETDYPPSIVVATDALAPNGLADLELVRHQRAPFSIASRAISTRNRPALFNGYRWNSPMSRQRCHFEASRSLTALEQDNTIIAAIEMSQSRWLVAALVPGVERHP